MTPSPSPHSNTPPASPRYSRSIIFGLLIGLGLGLVFMGGFFLRDLIGVPPLRSADPAAPGFPLVDEVQTLLDQVYSGQLPDYTRQQYGAIRGLLGALGDRFTFFIEPAVAASESDVLAGTYGGVGVEIVRSESGQLLLFPFADSPAAAAGIQAGDVLVRVNGTPVDVTMPADMLDQLLRGEVRPGSGVTLGVQAAADGAEQELFIPFAVINVPSIIWRTLPEDPRLGYMHILRFTERTPTELAGALDELRGAGIEALVLDLRNNAGGLLQESIQVADAFIDGGPLVIERRRGEETVYAGQGGGIALDLPLIVLVNGNTASGAEIVAGALQDTGRARLIGQKTYGKGTVQSIFVLSDRSSVHVTTSEWFTPNDRPLNGVGLIPDIEMIPDPNGRDVELGEAIRQLQAGLT